MLILDTVNVERKIALDVIVDPVSEEYPMTFAVILDTVMVEFVAVDVVAIVLVVMFCAINEAKFEFRSASKFKNDISI